MLIDTRPSVRWRLMGELSPVVRDHLADSLGASFTDENAPRAVMPAAPDVTLTVRPDRPESVVIAHFAPLDEVPPVKVDWLDSLVRRAAREATLAVVAGPEIVATGL